MKTPQLHDSRRYTGPNLLLPGAGAVLEVNGDDAAVRAGSEAWRRHLGPLLEAVGWGASEVAVDFTRGGATLAFSAPIDTLYAACELNEVAWSCAVADLDGTAPAESVDAALTRVRHAIAAEAAPRWHELARAARDHDVTFLWDDDEISLGVGAGSRTWPVSDLPAVADVPWGEIYDLPIVMVTGTNGKTTTVRLLGAIGRAADRVPGFSSTDGVFVGSQLFDGGDYSGPGGARAVLRHREVTFPILETARGGMQRRGLGVDHAAAVAITNIAEDHLGEFGVPDLEALAEIKFLITKAAGPGSKVVLNADDEETVARACSISAPIVWCSTDEHNVVVQGHVASGGDAYVLEGDAIVHHRGSVCETITSVADVPIALGGAARHNIANAITATALAAIVGVSNAQIAQGLSEFAGDATDNPGRANVYEIDGFRVIADFAHNPHGQRAFLEMVQALPAKRHFVLLGQAGDRSDESIRELTRIAWEGTPDRIYIKEMDEHRRGREKGEIPQLIEEELLAAGAPQAAIVHAASELEAVELALSEAQPGDLLGLPVHAQRQAVLDLLASRQAR
ncbi:MAG: Mur ligase family protein [Planctomycetota bacterium]